MYAVGLHVKTQIKNKHNNENRKIIRTMFIPHMTTFNCAILHQQQYVIRI